MGTHRNSHSAKLNRTLAFRSVAVAGATAIGLGALSTMIAPLAQADWFGGASGFGSGNASGNDILEGNGNGNGNNNYNNNNQFVGGVHGNGNVNQSTWAAGNTINNQIGLGFLNPVIGGIAINAGITASIGGFSTAFSAPVTALNGTNIGATLALNAATSASANLGAAVGLGLGGSNVGLQIPVAIPINAQVPIAAVLNLQGVCAGVSCDNSGGDAIANGGAQNNTAPLNVANQTQNQGTLSSTATNTQISNSQAHSNGNITQTNQVAGTTSVTAGATSGTAGSANTRVNTTAAAGGNVARSPSETNSQSGSGKNSTNSTGNGGTNNNTNGGGNTTNRNNGD
jgi:hypothetical protein